MECRAYSVLACNAAVDGIGCVEPHFVGDRYAFLRMVVDAVKIHPVAVAVRNMIDCSQVSIFFGTKI
jgi:hypothetical protein